MKLILGLGNPGDQYKNTWHNVGFLALDQLQKNWDFPAFKNNKKLRAEITLGEIDGEKIILAKPQTFMNHSGIAAQAIIKYYKIKPADMIVVHDDKDLPLEKIRLAKNSSAGGHNGVKSMIEYLKSQNFIRLKVGVKTAKTENLGTLKYVLEKIGVAEKIPVSKIIKKVADCLATLVNAGLEITMNKFN